MDAARLRSIAAIWPALVIASVLFCGLAYADTTGAPSVRVCGIELGMTSNQVHAAIRSAATGWDISPMTAYFNFDGRPLEVGFSSISAVVDYVEGPVLEVGSFRLDTASTIDGVSQSLNSSPAEAAGGLQYTLPCGLCVSIRLEGQAIRSFAIWKANSAP